MVYTVLVDEVHAPEGEKDGDINSIPEEWPIPSQEPGKPYRGYPSSK